MRRILILGITGMLGHKVFSYFNEKDGYETYGTMRQEHLPTKISGPYFDRQIIKGVDVSDFKMVEETINKTQPTHIINCIGIIKQLEDAKDPIKTISINSLLPHQLAHFCKDKGIRLIHISTDCVFSGRKGYYSEDDPSDAEDLYGRTKLLGEVTTGPNCITLRTSIIGHELKSKFGLIEWFLAQKGSINGFTKAIYSGFPTIEMARIIDEYVIPNRKLSGLFHVSSEPISKYSLLKLVADIYKKDIRIVPHDDFECDRSLDSTRFREATGYTPPKWYDLVRFMYDDYAIEMKY
ncbi:dTDP-4-dehydrorhamnose reductase family protein [Thermodesulfobacteriota bacterium]